MPHQTSTDLLVLHSLRCIGFAALPRVAAATGLPESDVESELIDLAVAGLVTRTTGDFGGWGLTDAGRAADKQRIAEELAIAGARPAVTKAFEEFDVLNPEMLDICTAWQMRTPTPAYEAKVLGLLSAFDRRTDGVHKQLSAALPRFQRYRDRLANALARAEAGEYEYITDNLESYHTIWFQLHEDLLATLGIPRH